jgi:hypothetical protein
MFNLSHVTESLYDAVNVPDYNSEQSYIKFIELCTKDFKGDLKLTEEDTNNIKTMVSEYKKSRVELEEKGKRIQSILNNSLVSKPFDFGDLTCDIKNKPYRLKTNGFEKLVNKMIVRK